MKIQFKGTEMTLEGNTLKVGDKMPDFRVTDNDLKEVSFADTKGTRVFLAVPSVDTQVCDMEVRKFNERVDKLTGIKIYAVSLDLPFALGRWCGVNGIEAVSTVSDYKDRSFGLATGTFIKELALLTRAVFVVDADHVLQYVEYVPEVTDQPDYEAAFATLAKL